MPTGTVRGKSLQPVPEDIRRRSVQKAVTKTPITKVSSAGKIIFLKDKGEAFARQIKKNSYI